MSQLIFVKYETWKAQCLARFSLLKANEEELNRIFIDIYGLQDELTPEVADRNVTVYRVIDEPVAEQISVRVYPAPAHAYSSLKGRTLHGWTTTSII